MAASEPPRPSAESTDITPNTLQHEAFAESTFFQEQRASALPTPEEIRALNIQSGNDRATMTCRPSPVAIPSLGLFVKYGSDVTVVEALTQRRMRELLADKVPIPEVYGWAKDGGQVFIYMELVQGVTVQDRWAHMNEDERQNLCNELRCMVNAWRDLSQDQVEGDIFIGGMGKTELNDIFVYGHPELQGPFLGADATQQFHNACHIELSGDMPIVFTHNDLCPPNILLSPGENTKVVAIIDWNQSGWLPWYWESCKSRQVGLVTDSFSDALYDEWQQTYVPAIIDSADDLYYHSFIYFALSRGM